MKVRDLIAVSNKICNYYVNDEEYTPGIHDELEVDYFTTGVDAYRGTWFSIKAN